MNTDTNNDIPELAVDDGNNGLQKLFVFIAFAVIAIALSMFTPLGSFFSVENIEHIVSDLGCWGPGVIILLGLFSPLLFIPRWPLAFAGGLLYGLVPGVLLATFSSTLGAVLQYYFASNLLAPAARRVLAKFKLSEGSIPAGKIFIVFFFLRAFPLSNFTATNLLAGAMKVRLIPYIAASFLGMLPSSIMYASWGKLMKKPSSATYWVAFLSVAFIVGGCIIVKKKFYPWLKGISRHQETVSGKQ